MTPVLEVKHLHIALPSEGDRRHAVSAVNFTVGRGEIVCLVGESGSGKSVIAQSVMGLLPKSLPVSDGRILLEGEDITHAPLSRLRELRATRMSMIFQEPMTALNPVMRCGEQIDEVLRAHTKLSESERKKKIIAMIEEVSLPDPERMFRAFPHQLSGGQRQRIMIAMALVLEPVLLIADEPTTALDVTTQAQILHLISELQRKHGTGVLFITHDFGVVAEIADRVAVLRLGDLVEIGPKDALLMRPQHDYTKMLIAAVPGIHPKSKARQADAPVVLQVSGLDKRYGGQGWFNAKHQEVHAAKSVSFTIRKGETLGIVGESGSGKSTVARCVVRLIDPSAGSIDLEGNDLARLSGAKLRALRKRVQIVFQDPYRSLNPRRTVGETIMEGPMNFGLSREEAARRARSLMAWVRMDASVLNRYPHQFSGGQRQRISIARALAMEPELLIADEAVSALDVSVQAQVLELLEEIRQRLNLAMLFITHDLRVAAQVCDDIVVMSKGEVVEYGPALEVFNAPKHAYTKSLFAAAPGRDFPFHQAASAS
ncbi:MAG: ABC transporter ATP-binding protein [Betaproteobacteria bacterium]|mgnify:FL=1|jgi:peptide/nickel transport system ATP-binding protein|nr:ABC transporter ATP-binding protein [Pseudomonadota bacterium]NBO02811.1 ABC transporter ATP-binding protein [Betaproteobacteria bacterium]NBO94739.1 ABC transporter ATP-binding protein [Betaproteobacteria bacterium]NBP35538.1 ABC transporter ATP-binding protein [Betaproteobacteria bacterium]NBP37194.1 ABC transporter ATP-binding protein [Betaproteobacteria bacterium]